MSDIVKKVFYVEVGDMPRSEIIRILKKIAGKHSGVKF
jgi:hypothetical protein